MVEIQALANHEETQELTRTSGEKTLNSQGGTYGTTLRTRALGFSIFLTTRWSEGVIYTSNIPPS
jgi:hypothetical protein